MNTNIKPVILVIVSVLFAAATSFFSYGQKLLPLPKPTHSEAGVPRARLTVVKEIKSDINEDIFFARLRDTYVSKTGFMYVFDIKLRKLFIFNEKFQYLGQFLEQGQGPGEIHPHVGAAVSFGIGPDNNIYMCNGMGDRLSIFSPMGKHIKDIRMNRIKYGFAPFPPVVDDEGYIYAYSVNGGIVDKYDPDMKLVHTYLDQKLNNRFVIYRPPFEQYNKRSPFPMDRWFRSGNSTTSYDLTPDNRLIIYQYRSSEVYIFEGKKQVSRFDILLDRAIAGFRKVAEKTLIKQEKQLAKRNSRSRMLFQPAMFDYFFVDKDAPYFYLTYFDENNNRILCQFDFNGKLVKIFDNLMKQYSVDTRRNGFFYGRSAPEWSPVILKEEGKP